MMRIGGLGVGTPRDWTEQQAVVREIAKVEVKVISQTHKLSQRITSPFFTFPTFEAVADHLDHRALFPNLLWLLSYPCRE